MSKQNEKLIEVASILAEHRKAWSEGNVSRSNKLYTRYEKSVKLYCGYCGMTEREMKQATSEMASAYMGV